MFRAAPSSGFKEVAIAAWVRRELGTVTHEMRVSRIAAQLFAITCKWHGLGEMESKLLTLACLVHDVGRSRGKKGHAKCGARMIMETATLPLSAHERRRLAYLTRYHRGKVPDTGNERYLLRDEDDLHAMRILLGMLRAADGLDCRAGDNSCLVATVKGRLISVFGYVAASGHKLDKLRAKGRKSQLLESMLRCELNTDWICTDPLALVS